MRRPLLMFVLGTALANGLCPAASSLDRTTEGQDVTVHITSPFSDLPPSGDVPFRVDIKNDRSTPGTWRVFFQGSSNSLGATYYAQDMTVAPNTTGSFDVLVPMPMFSADWGGISLNTGVSGPGIPNADVFSSFYTNTPGTRSPFTIIGSNLLGTIGTGPLESYDKDLGKTFYGSVVDADNLPSDWRAYSGVAVFLLKDTEWLTLSSAQRAAISDYVAQGGHLTIFTSDNPDTRTPQLQLPAPDGKAGSYGFGAISVVRTATFPPAADVLYTIVEQEQGPSGTAQATDQNFSTWGLRQLVGTIAVSGAFILTFVLLFGTLIGPINLFVFARGSKRFRLFWTTPLISIVACLTLIAGILLTDGLGGTGRQMIAVFSLPGMNREAVVQEQVAQTAVLFSTRWHNDQNYLITPISAQAINDASAPTGVRLYSSRTDLADSPDTFRQQGNEFSGNWFRSRTVSGQYLQAVRPSRSVLTLLNPRAPGSAQQPPVVLSSFPQELTTVFLRDQQGSYWTCEHLEPGSKKTCSASEASDFYHFWAAACANAGGKLRPLLNEAAGRNGCFYATGIPPASDTLTTLGEIRWQVASGVYLGPWVAAPQSETGP